MFGTKKTLIVVYKDELLMNQLKKMIDSHDDTADRIVGTKDNSINIVSWTEKVWLANKQAGNIQGKILFLGDIKGTDKLIPVLDIKYDEYGVRYGWAGNQAVVYADISALKNKEKRLAFLKKISNMPIPKTLKTDNEEKTTTEVFLGKAALAVANLHALGIPSIVSSIKDNNRLKNQMMFLGIVTFYNDGLDQFMNM